MEMLGRILKQICKKLENPEMAVIAPGVASAEEFSNVGVSYQQAGDLEKAQRCYEAAIRVNPKFSPAYNNLGFLHASLGRYDKAIKLYRKAVFMEPTYFEAMSNLAYCLKVSGGLEESLSVYDQIISLDDRPMWHWKRALVLLLLGKFDEGWREYAARMKLDESCVLRLGLKLWEGQDLAGKSILVTSEQGIGDEIMFAGCIPTLVANAKHCLVYCDTRLVGLFARSFPEATIEGGSRKKNTHWLKAHYPIDFEVPMGSLPQFLFPTLDRGGGDFPIKSYVVADVEKKNYWRERLRRHGNALNIGISWRGGKQADEKLQRSIPLSGWGSILRQPKFTFVNLQYGDCSTELSDVNDRFGCTIASWDDFDAFHDIEGFAALVAAMDLVITIDNSTAHFAGALGVPTWLLLPLSPDWRWGISGDASLWYPSVRFFRQGKVNDWSGVLKRVAKELSRYGV